MTLRLEDFRQTFRVKFLNDYKFTYEADRSTESNNISLVPKNPLTNVLVSFWHIILQTVVKCESFAIAEASRVEKQKQWNESAWLNNDFAQHLQNLYEKRYHNGDSAVGDDNNTQFLFPFVMTMRFESWFKNLPLDINYSQQILLRFEKLYIPKERQTLDQNLFNDKIDEKIFRLIWHKIVFMQTVLLNNVFGFYLLTLTDVTKYGSRIYWDEKWMVANVYSIAGSLSDPQCEQKMSLLERAANKPTEEPLTVHEFTWIAILLQNIDSFRLVYCSLSSFDAEKDIFVAPHLPFFVIDEVVLSEEASIMLNNDTSLQKEIKQHRIPQEVIVFLQNGKLKKENKNATFVQYKVDLVREYQQIFCRILQLYDCIAECSRFISKTNEKISKLRKLDKHSLKEKSEYEQQLEMLDHLRKNCVSLFVLICDMESTVKTCPKSLL